MNRRISNIAGSSTFQLIYIIVNDGMGSKVLHTAKEYGICGGTIFLGKGTVRNPLLNFLCLYDERKEIILIGADKETAERSLDKLNKKFKFDKPNHGIVFTTGLQRIIGSKNFDPENQGQERGVRKSMYQLIISIVNKGRAEDVIDAATEAGARGGTIVNARGSGIHETMKIFNMDIEPEKEIVMILSKKEITENIMEAIRIHLDLDQPGNGVIFVQDVDKAYGIYDN